jgi:ectoine hydroxylase-related dioxygenase (phytanoyl-CoA dioxygenase family)
MGSYVDESPSVSLTDAQVARFEEQGFLELDRLTSEAEVVALQSVYDRLFEPGAGIAARDRIELAADGEGGPSLPQILNPDRYAPELLQTIAFRNASNIAGQILGDSVQYMGMHAIRKPPHHGAETPWHQDEAYWDPAWEHRAISVWMPLQRATLGNGCMQFVAGSHRRHVQAHRLINASSDGLVITDPGSVCLAVACPLPAGGATIHAGRTLHYAGPNRSDQPRRALIMAFRAPPVPVGAPRAFPWQRPEWYE